MQLNTKAKTIFRGESVRVKGTTLHPLFNAKDVIVKVLEYRDIHANNFYQTNYSDQQYVVFIDNKCFLTEKGIYKCLYSSQKEVAIRFIDHVI